MDNRQFALWLQPQVDLRTGEVTSAEALLRMQQPDGTWELPEGMIERIESCGLMVTVGYWVLEESCRQLAARQQRGITLPLSVNLSALQLMHPTMVPDMLELIHRYRIQPHTLILEVTESRCIDNPDDAVAILKPLRNAGIRIALDDWYGVFRPASAPAHENPAGGRPENRQNLCERAAGGLQPGAGHYPDGAQPEPARDCRRY